MTATDELRALLDDAGVEWDKGAFPNEARTYWRDVVARPWNEQRLYVTALLTPAQAIAATLGRGTCKMVIDNHHRVDKVTTSWGCVCSACGGFHEFTHGEGWAFCPSCGRRIVEVDR